MNIQHSIATEVLEAFHLMWDNFPETVTLVHQSREIIAINKVANEIGVLKPGMNCAKIGQPGAHKGCLADKALSGHKTTYVHIPTAEGNAIAFWLPLDGYSDYYVHFGVGISLNYKTGQQKDNVPATTNDSL
jgi:hypothetical protein